MGTPAKMKALIYSPYWETLGGGERYMASAALFCAQNGYKTEISSLDLEIIKKIHSRFNLDISECRVNSHSARFFANKKNILESFFVTRNYDLIFYLSDGSIPSLFGKKNIIHMQVPFTRIKGKSLLNRIKLSRINKIIVNSKFSKKYIDREFGVNSIVLYPPVSSFKAFEKEKIILSIGRFDNLMNHKRQDVLIQAYKSLNRKGWKLILAGGVQYENDYIKKLFHEIKGYDIEIKSNITYRSLKHLYGQASIYWHAAGYGFDLRNTPEKAEHFGMSTVEAMSAGAIPIVYRAGGLKEIITENKDGFLWKDLCELIGQTRKIIDAPNPQMSKRSILKAAEFSKEKYNDRLRKIIS